MALPDLESFSRPDLLHRMARGGLPPFFLSDDFPEKGYQEWLDSFWAKDIEELFNVEKRSAFLKFFELLALQSGGLFEAKSFASPCGVSHTTIASYLNIMAETHIAYVLRPFHRNAAKEIITAPKVYFFDTGFMTYFKGTNELHASERGHYWEHLVLNELLTFIDRGNLHYWRDKAKNEIDFIVKLRGKPPIAIECKWQAKEFTSKSITKFRELHPDGLNILVSNDITARRTKSFGDAQVTLVPLAKIRSAILGR